MSIPFEQGYTVDVLQGGQITVPGKFFTFVGSSVPADASGVTVTITSVTTSTTILGPTSVGVTHVSQGVYSYTWVVAAAQATGDYLITWSGTVASTLQSSGVTVTVAAPAVASPAPGVYATVGQYRQVTGDLTTPDQRVAFWLPLASSVLDVALVGAVYSTDANSMPTNPMVIDCFMRACCEQVRYEIANNDPAQVKDQYVSSNVGGVNLTRAAAATARVLPPLAPRAAAVLRVAGVLPNAPLISW